MILRDDEEVKLASDEYKYYNPILTPFFLLVTKKPKK
jgi:hypothetical protein